MILVNDRLDSVKRHVNVTKECRGAAAQRTTAVSRGAGRSPRGLRCFLAVVTATIVAALGIAHPALANSPARPNLFALSTSEFPAGSSIVRADVEGNRQLIQDGVYFFTRHPAQLGRISGYYMQADEGDGVQTPHVSTAYLISIFHTVKQASNAWDLRYSSWFAANYYSNPPSAPIHLGNGGEEAWFVMHPASDALRAELFFRCGAVLIEVFQTASGGMPMAAQKNLVFRIGRDLNSLAHAHPLGR